MTTKEFLELNMFSESYCRDLDFDYVYGGKHELDMSRQSEDVIKRAERDIEIIKERIEKFNAKEGFRIGDHINLPDGQSVQMTHIWEEAGRVQTGGNGSMHIGSSGYISRSGSLDSGLNAEDLILTDETREGTVWIFHEGWAGGNRGVHYKFPFRVYKTKEGADLSGIPQIERLRKQKIKEQSEVITRINGNGNEYDTYMPEVYLENVNELPIGDTTTVEGVEFDVRGKWMIGQPMKLSQINALLKGGKYAYTYYNNASHQNTLFIEKASIERRAKIQWPAPGVFYKTKK